MSDTAKYMKKNTTESFAKTNPELLKEWDYEKNSALGLDPENIISGSNKKAWWKCAEGHEWKAPILFRTRIGTECPYCIGRKAIKGETDLATTNPELIKEWDYEKNNKLGLFPDELKAKSSKKVWWKCDKGHEWEAMIFNRTSGSSCPYCSYKTITEGVNDLTTTHPKLIEEWNFEKNDKLKVYPTKISAISHKKVFWKCAEGHEWETTVNNRTKKGSKCPYCTGRKVQLGYNDLTTTNPELIEEWNFEKNSDLGLEPTSFPATSKKLIWWKCKRGHEWKDFISNRVNGSGCPSCNKIKKNQGVSDLATTNPEILKEWNYEKNSPLGFYPNEITAKSTEKVWWKCEKGHEWQAVIYTRIRQGTGCPCCNREKGKVISGENDLATTHTNLLKEWNYEKNDALGIYPTNYTAKNSIIKPSWKCVKGHEWEATIYNRAIKNQGCPICVQERKKSLSLVNSHPELMKEWDYEKNDKLGINPNTRTANSTNQVWWKCKNGHEWKALIFKRTKGEGCPYCNKK